MTTPTPLRGLALAALAGACLLPSAARAETPVSGTFQFQLGGYHPQIDGEAALNGNTPYYRIFGSKGILLAELEWDRQFFQKFGSLAGGVSAGYGEVYGHGIVASSGEVSTDLSSMKVVPLKLMLTYRFDVLAKRYGIPLVPFAQGGFVYQLFSISSGSGETATALDDKTGSTSTGSGARYGVEGDLGLALLLDFFDEPLAKDFDIDLGVNHSYFFGEHRSSKVDDFGGKSLNFSDNYWLFGLALEY